MTPTIKSIHALVLGVLFATALLVSAAPTPSAGPTRIPLNAMRLPQQAAEQLAKRMETGPAGQFHSMLHQTLATGAVPITFDPSSFIMVGPVNVGSPAQSVLVWVDTWTQDFYLLDPSVTSSDDSGAARFDYSSSTSATVNSQPFTALYGSVMGNSTVTDSIQFGSVSVSGLTFGEATTFPSWIASMPVSGAIGLAPFNGYNATNITGFGTQLAASASSSDTAAVSVSLVVSALNITAQTMTQTGQITVGAQDSDTCTAGTYTYAASDPIYSTGFRVDSITGQTPSGDALSLSINTNRSMVIAPMLPGMIGSNQFVQLIVNATGLVAQGNNLYAMSCDDVPNVQNLTLNLAGGATLTVSPADYIFQNVTSDGTASCGSYLYTFGNDETDSGASASNLPNGLGQGYLNNHCYSHNYASGMIGIASAQQQTMTIISQ